MGYTKSSGTPISLVGSCGVGRVVDTHGGCRNQRLPTFRWRADASVTAVNGVKVNSNKAMDQFLVTVGQGLTSNGSKI